MIGSVRRGELRSPTLRTIARSLGIEAPHILYYFGSREALLEAVLRRWDHDAAQLADGPDMEAGFTLDFYCDTIRSNASVPGIIHLYLHFASEAIDPEHTARPFFKERFERTSRLLADAIRAEQRSGIIPGSLDPEVHARHLIALADGLQLQALVDPTVKAGDDLAIALRELRGLRTQNR